MRYIVLILLLLMPWPVLAQNSTTPPVTVVQDKGVLIRSIDITGFVLGDKDQFIKLFKPHRDKYLTKSDMDDILQKIQQIYEQGGYQSLVSIDYKVNKKHLVFTVTLIR